MVHKHLSFAATVIATAVLGAPFALAQAGQAQPAPDSSTPSAPAGKIAKPSPYPSPDPSPYQGVSQPPAEDILTTDDQPEEGASSAAGVAAAAPVSSTHGVSAAAAPASDAIQEENDADSAAVSSPQLSRKDRDGARISGADPDEEIVTYVPGPANAVPEGTVFNVRMLQDVTAADAFPGTEFRAKLSQNLVHDGRVVVPIGSELRGKIVHVSYGRRIGGLSVIHLRPEEFILPDGTRYRLHARVIDTRGSDTKATGEGDISSKAHGKRALVELAIGGGGGALIGAKVGGPVGAAVGSAIGAGAMGAHLLLANQAVDLPEESTVIFSLTDPMFLNPSRD